MIVFLNDVKKHAKVLETYRNSYNDDDEQKKTNNVDSADEKNPAQCLCQAKGVDPIIRVNKQVFLALYYSGMSRQNIDKIQHNTHI